MIAHATIGEQREAVLPRDPAPGGQFCCNGTRDTTSPTPSGDWCFLLARLRGYITRPTEMSSVELSWQFGSWKPPQELQWDRRQPARTWNRGYGNWGIYGVGSRFKTTGEHTADWEDLVRVVVNCSVYELAIALQLFVVTPYKRSINPITKPSTSTVTHTRDNISDCYNKYAITLLQFNLFSEEPGGGTGAGVCNTQLKGFW
jgi:hypothetical protein